MSQPEKLGLLHSHNPHSSKTNTNDDRSNSSEDWSSSYSTNSSLSRSESIESYIPNWDEHIQSDGTLLYIEYSFNHSQTIGASSKPIQPTENSLNAARSKFNRTSTRRSKKPDNGSKLTKFMNRQIVPSKPLPKSPRVPVSKPDSAKVKFTEITEGDLKEIYVCIDPSSRHKFGRRASISEAILGLSICPFPEDPQRLMIAGFMPNVTIGEENQVKVGDWLKSIDGRSVSASNVEPILLSYSELTEVKLTIQRLIAGIDDSEQNTIQKITNLKDFIMVVQVIFGQEKSLNESHVEMPFSVMYLTMQGLDDNGPEGQDVLFCYPARENNYLYSSRGSFLTLNSLLTSTFKSSPIVTTVAINGIDYYVSYTSYHDDLLLIAISSQCLTIEEVKLKTQETLRFLECLNATLPNVFQQKNHQNLFDICTLTTIFYQSGNVNCKPAFERSLLESHYVPLPKEAQLRIDDALGEMEAMDYREWNDEPLKSHREFYIVGSALYYKSYLLASHIPTSDLLDVEAYLRMNGISRFIHQQSVKDLLIWQEIYPKSVERGLAQNDNIYGIPKGRWFLSIVARNHLLLAVILESRHLTHDNVKPTDPIPPSQFYVEEIQDTIEHLRTGGIETLASTWINSNKRPQIIQPSRSDESASCSSSVPKRQEIISILKRPMNSTESILTTTSTIDSSKRSTSAGGSSVALSEDSNQRYDDEESDSDWDGFPDNRRSSSGFDMSDMTGTLLKEVSDIIPIKITAGEENVLFHYVQLEVGDGIILAPTNLSPTNSLLDSFRKACLLIHKTLQNTINHRYNHSQESNASNSNQSFSAIKEHGMLIRQSKDDDSNETIEFWVIGRLFSSPSKELYVCHRSDVPQNLVEIAFRLSLNSAG